MKITTNHSASSYGMPVILDDRGHVMDYAPGVKAARAKLNLTAEQLAEKLGVSVRTVNGWEQGRLPSAQGLNMLGILLDA